MVSEVGTQFLGILIGFIAYICLYLGKGIQKYAIEGFKDKKKNEVSKSVKTTKNTGIWIGGTVLTASFLFIQWLPFLDFFNNISPNLIAPLEGFGLIVLLVFSYFVLKEPINKIQVIGASIIIIGLVLININPTNNTETEITVDYQWFWILFGVIFGIILTGIFLSIYFFKNKKLAGSLIAVLSGACMAWQTISKSISGVNTVVIWAVIVILYAIATLGTTQWAFTKIKANLVVPIFTSTSIILTAILSIIILNEVLFVTQVFGILVILGGVICISVPEGILSSILYKIKNSTKKLWNKEKRKEEN